MQTCLYVEISMINVFVRDVCDEINLCFLFAYYKHTDAHALES